MWVIFFFFKYFKYILVIFENVYVNWWIWLFCVFIIISEFKEISIVKLNYVNKIELIVLRLGCNRLNLIL